MKFGEQLDRQSVPGWSLYNIDYNSLKHFIKVHTTRDQATAIAIPGRPDAALEKFEKELFAELCRQHDRVDLFVSSKADEISRRMQHMSGEVRTLMLRRTAKSGLESPRKQRKSIRCEHALLQCGNEIQALERFVGAQVVAFRKILKKYKKWTGSAALGVRFKDAILSNPKSFTRRDFSHLQSQDDELLATLRAATPRLLDAVIASRHEADPTDQGHRKPRPAVTFASPTECDAVTTKPTGAYWNEYDDGSETGECEAADESYVIYVNPDDKRGIPGFSALSSVLCSPVERMKKWFGNTSSAPREREPMLAERAARYGATYAGYGTDVDDDSETASPRERGGSYGYASSEDFPPGYVIHHATLPSINEQSINLYREKVLSRGATMAFAVSVVLLLAAAILVTTGRHRLRVEVDAGVMVCVLTSLGCACSALVMAFSRGQAMSWLQKLTVCFTFVLTCVLNGALLVMVAANVTP